MEKIPEPLYLRALPMPERVEDPFDFDEEYHSDTFSAERQDDAEPRYPRLMDMTDEDILALYSAEIEQDENTFDGVTLSYEIKAKFLVDYVYGSTGYFVQEGRVEAGRLRKPGTTAEQAGKAGMKADLLFRRMYVLLYDTLIAHGIPESEHGQKIVGMLAAAKRKHSGSKNRRYHTHEMKHLKKVRARMGAAALRGAAD